MQTESLPRTQRVDAPTIECRNPATLERLGDVPALERDEVVERVRRARCAQLAWGRTRLRQRARVCRALLSYIVDHQAEICRLAARDAGQTLHDAALGDVLPVVEQLRYLVAHGERDLAPESRSSGFMIHQTVRLEHAPLGVVGVICPSSAPFHAIFSATLPALFAGNAVVCKVSEWSAWSAADFQAIFDDVLTRAGSPTELVQIITGAGDTGAALASAGVEKIFFAGSSASGKKLMEVAAATLTPVVLALSGNDPMIVCDDADLDRAVEAAMRGVFGAAGQRRGAVGRIYLMDGVHDRFVARVVDQVRQLRQGPPSHDPQHDDLGRYDVGAMSNPRQLELVTWQIEEAVRKGARVLVGGKRNPVWKGRFFEPTVLVDCDHTMAITREETFGPVMTLVRVRSEDEAIRLANDCDYGLGASVFTRSRARAERIARAISAGMTVTNDHGVAHLLPAAPLGALRSSGFGTLSGREGLRACTSERVIVGERFRLRFASRRFPVTRGSYGLIEGAIGVVYGDARQKLAGLARVARAVIAHRRANVVRPSREQYS